MPTNTIDLFLTILTTSDTWIFAAALIVGVVVIFRQGDERPED